MQPLPRGANGCTFRLMAKFSLFNRKINAQAASASALVDAAQQGKFEMMGDLLEFGLDVNFKNTRGATALMWAAFHGNAQGIALLLIGKADVDARDNDGMTALMYAAWKGNCSQIIQALINKGADVNA